MQLENIRIAVRSLVRNKLYSLINMLGLTMGLAVVILIGLFLLDELTYDAFHEKGDRIVRVVEHKGINTDRPQDFASGPLKLVLEAEQQFPEVESATFLNGYGRMLLINAERQSSFYEEMLIADEDFLQIFDFPLATGNPATALQEPQTIVLSEELAQNLFGDEDPIGKILETDRNLNFRVTGVFEAIPGNSHLQFTTLVSSATIRQFSNWERISSTDWNSNFWTTYLLLKPTTDKEALASKITTLVQSRRTPETPESTFELQALNDIHFRSDGFAQDRNSGEGNLSYIYIFGIVGLFILFIASINYINLTTARGIHYGKEVGVRKVIGATKMHLVKRFFTESLVLCLTSFAIAINLVSLLLPRFNTFTQKDIQLNLGDSPLLIAFLLGLLVLVSLLAGGYPALYLSRFNPVRILKGRNAQAKGQPSMRKALVVFQYMISSVMIIGTLVALLQLNFIRSKDLGFSEEQLLVADINSGRVRNGFDLIKQSYTELPGVSSVSVSSRVPGEWKVIPEVALRIPGVAEEDAPEAYLMGVDEDFVQTFEIELLQGQNFTGDPQTDSTALIINESAAKLLGVTKLSDQAIQIPGISFNSQESQLSNPFNGVIKGIVKDFHFQSLHDKIEPLVMAYRNNPMHSIDYFTARIDMRNAEATIASMTEILQEVDPNHIFEYHFLDDQLALFYETDRQRSQLFSLAAIFAIFIACMGVFGLAAYTAQRKTKEIGVRKVLGASIPSLIGLIAQEFIRLVLWSLVLAVPLAWWAADAWLADFAYRISLQWWMFALPGVLAVAVTLLTVSSQALKAARVNPVEALRYE